ncbi:MAG: hypothetical protein JWO77_2634 [Ilumatobacteraceae bacterium]|nr:hypothetical protein [Ilumatobacteraceae bacterium]
MGEICGFGTASGHRIVVGSWPASPFGPFADVMHEQPDGTRILRAPSVEIARFVEETYRFDRVDVVPVAVERTEGQLAITAGDLAATVAIGRRSVLGGLLRLVPARVATSPRWCSLIDPVARIALRGVRTRGTAGNDRQEWYGATDQHLLAAVAASLGDHDLGALADVWPPVRFGFSSTPKTPSIVRVTTTIRRSAGGPTAPENDETPS